jgi:hypothetical protein
MKLERRCVNKMARIGFSCSIVLGFKILCLHFAMNSSDGNNEIKIKLS